MTTIKQILLPYRRINGGNRGNKEEIFSRNYIDGLFNNYVYLEDYSKKWFITSYDINMHDSTYKDKFRQAYDTYEEATKILDEILIENGFILCKNDDDVLKYQILL